MTEEKFVLLPLSVQFKCIKCEDGYMVVKSFDGKYAYDGEKVMHVCNRCKYPMFLKGEYPKLEYMEIGKLDEGEENGSIINTC